MPFDTAIVIIIVLAGFAAFAGTLAWSTWYSNGPRRQSGDRSGPNHA